MPYPEEIFYSNIARYNYYSGKTNAKETAENISGNKSTIPTISFPGNLNFLEKQMDFNKSVTSEEMICKHTLFPLYEPFLPEKRKKSIKKSMKTGNASNIYTKIGFVAGSICEKQYLEYCPECASEDLNIFKEPYFHRVHQVQGVFVCPKHMCCLNKYHIPYEDKSRIRYIRLDSNQIDLFGVYKCDDRLNNELTLISKSVLYILQNDLSEFNIETIHRNVIYFLEEKNLITLKGHVKQIELSQQFQSFFSSETLSLLESEINNKKEFNWIKVLTRKPKRVVHPIRNILFILFLCGSVEKFFNSCQKKHTLTFGMGPWPCLNPISQHYHRDVIKSCSISYDTKSKKPIGTFKCSCGFIYARSGPDISENDKYRIGAIKQYGKEWELKLKEHLLNKNNSLRQIARLMGCDPKTILKYQSKINDNEQNLEDENFIDAKKDNAKYIHQNEFEEIYKKDVIDYISKSPTSNRKTIRNDLKKQYAYLYRNNREWLFQNLPVKTAYHCIKVGKINWWQRDKETLVLLKNAYDYLINLEKPTRITQSSLARKINKLALLDKYIDKLPEVKKFLDKHIETIEEFQLRRVMNCCNTYNKTGNEIKKWQVLREAGIRKEYAEKLNDKIEYIINMSKEHKKIN